VDQNPQKYHQFKAAACHVAPVFLDTEKTIEKTCAIITEAARNGASLIVFPEAFVPAFPIWAALQAPIRMHDAFKLLASQALNVPGPEIEQIQRTARSLGVYVSVGINELSDASVGCIWNTNVFIGSDGAILNKHRKLVPTFYEKLVHASGDGAGLRVLETDVGKIGALICGENTNPLARYTLMAQGEQVHISTYPPSWPTRALNEAGAYDLERAIEIRAAAHSFEAKAFNIVAAGHIDQTMIDWVSKIGPEAVEIVENSPRGVSMVLDPTGTVISEKRSHDEGIVYANIDTSKCVEPKQFHDVVGYYNRFDVFSLNVNRERLRPANLGACAPEGVVQPLETDVRIDSVGDMAELKAGE
jgi:aliphatic nitrilase